MLKAFILFVTIDHHPMLLMMSEHEDEGGGWGVPWERYTVGVKGKSPTDGDK